MSSALCGAGKSRVRTRPGKFNELFDSLASLALPFLSFRLSVIRNSLKKTFVKLFCCNSLWVSSVSVLILFPARLFFQVLFIFELIKKLKRWVTSGMCKFKNPDLYGEAMLKTKTSVEERWQLY